MKVYRLYLAKPILIFYLVLLIALPFVVAAVLTCAALGLFGADGPPTMVFVVVLLFVLFGSYMCLRIPFEIQVENDTAEFRSVLGKRVIPLSEISSIQASRFSLGFVDVKYGNGSIHLINQIDGFHDFVTTIKSSNPSVIVKGC